MSRTAWSKPGSAGCTGAGGGGAGCATVTRAVASRVPPGPFAMRRYVVEPLGVTDCEPLGCTAPTPSMLTSFALSVCQVSCVACPGCTLAGFDVRVALGAA